MDTGNNIALALLLSAALAALIMWAFQPRRKSDLIDHYVVCELDENERISGELESIQSGFVILRLDQPLQPAGGAKKSTTRIAIHENRVKSMALYTLQEMPKKGTR